MTARKRKRKGVSYAKWGYFFIVPFFTVYFIFTLFPQLLTVYNSFFMNYMDGLTHVGPKFVGLANYKAMFTPNASGDIVILKYLVNTMILWVIGAVPQFVVALLLAVLFTSTRLNLKGQPFFKSVIYMPNLIMASAFAMLFFALFSKVGPVNQILTSIGYIEIPFDFLSVKISVRMLVGLMNFLMWFGNTTLLLMAGIMGIDTCLFESASIDGASSLQVFTKITLPLLMPILTYVFITSMIGGFQMFDVPQVLTKGIGTPNESSMTLVMYLNRFLGTSKNYGMAGAVSMFLFVITGALGILIYQNTAKQYKK